MLWTNLLLSACILQHRYLTLGDVQGRGKGEEKGEGGGLRTSPAVTYAACAND
jgi:hypothetical protein